MIQTISSNTTAHRLAIGLAIVAQFMALVVSAFWLVNFVLTYLPRGMHWFPWAYLILVNVLCAAGFWIIRSQHPGIWMRRTMWVTQGLLLGSILAGAWSMGVFFFPSWVLLMASAFIDWVHYRRSVLEILLLLLVLAALAYIQFNFLLSVSNSVRPF